jgi:hypothetical protein
MVDKYDLIDFEVVITDIGWSKQKRTRLLFGRCSV